MHWYKRDPNAAIVGMSPLTLEERGAYNGVLDLLYAADGDVVADDVAIAKQLTIQTRTWRKVKAALIAKGKVWEKDGKILAKRVEKELKKAGELSEKQSNNAAKRWEKPENNSDINEGSMPGGNASKTTSTTKTTPIYTLANGVTIPLKVETPIKPNQIVTIEVPPPQKEFEIFWARYPKKKQKIDAEKAFHKALARVSFGTLMGALEREKIEWAKGDFKWIPYPASWLNKGGWANEPEPQEPEPKFAIPR